MKKVYEKNNCVIFFSVVLFIIICIFIMFLLMSKVIIYKNISGVVASDNVLTFLVNDEDLKLFHSNKTIYLFGKKCRFDILKIDKDLLKRDGDMYHQVYLKVKFSKKYKVKDVLEISIVEKRLKCINIFKIIWEV